MGNYVICIRLSSRTVLYIGRATRQRWRQDTDDARIHGRLSSFFNVGSLELMQRLVASSQLSSLEREREYEGDYTLLPMCITILGFSRARVLPRNYKMLLNSWSNANGGNSPTIKTLPWVRLHLVLAPAAAVRRESKLWITATDRLTD